MEGYVEKLYIYKYTFQIGGVIMGDVVYKLLKKSLDASALRQRVTDNNIANINTKGFKRSEVVFEEKLNAEINKQNLSGKNLESVDAEVVTDNSTSFRTDGNNVDIDREMANMAANNILYNTLVTQVNTKIGIMRYVISEGRK
jgi:flagellar basal-body rod protein FlgB